MSPSSILENILASAQILTLGTTVGSSITPFVSHRFLSATVFFFFFVDFSVLSWCGELFGPSFLLHER